MIHIVVSPHFTHRALCENKQSVTESAPGHLHMDSAVGGVAGGDKPG